MTFYLCQNIVHVKFFLSYFEYFRMWTSGRTVKRLVLCPGFSWDRVNFLLSSWYSALFCIDYERKVDNTLKFQLLLSSACPRSRTFQFPVICQGAGAQGAVRAHGQGTWPKLSKGIFHAIEHSAQCMNWGKLAGRDQLLHGDGMDISQQVMSNWVGCFCLSWLLFLSFSFSL